MFTEKTPGQCRWQGREEAGVRLAKGSSQAGKWQVGAEASGEGKRLKTSSKGQEREAACTLCCQVRAACTAPARRNNGTASRSF